MKKLLLLIYTCFCCQLVLAQGGGLRAHYYKGVSFDSLATRKTDSHINFNWDSLAPVAGTSPSHFSIRWTGSIIPKYSETYTFALLGTHTWRLWINNILLVDHIAATEDGLDYHPDIKAADFWNRFSQSVIALKAGMLYDIRLEYVKKDQGKPTPARIQLLWASASQPTEVVPTHRFKSFTTGSKPQVARSAREFYESIGLVFQRGEELGSNNYSIQRSLLDELDIYTVRMALFPSTWERNNLGRIEDLHDNLGIKINAYCRESSLFNDPDSMMNVIGRLVKRLKRTILHVEGPNEPNLSGERFQYRGHGYDRVTGRRVGEGWRTGTALFLADVKKKLLSDPLTRDVKLASSAPADLGFQYPTATDFLVERALEKGINLDTVVDYGNVHKYHMTYPESPRFGMLMRPMRRVLDLRKPFVSTEMGYNTSNVSHDKVDEPTQAKFILRNYLTTFNAGFKHTYKFALKSEENGHSFGIVRNDNSKKPAFDALKNLIALIKEDSAFNRAGQLYYQLQGNTNGVYQALLQKSDGRFYLVLWQGNAIAPDSLRLKLRLLTPTTTASVYLPKDSAEPRQTVTKPRTIDLILTDHPVIVEITPWDFKDFLESLKPRCLLSVSPNPVSDEMKVSYDDEAAGPVQAVIKDFNGREKLRMTMPTVTGMNEFTIDVNSLPYGLYTLSIADGQRVNSIRFIKR